MEKILHSWIKGSGLAVEDELVEPVVKIPQFPPSRHSTEVLKSLDRIERNHRWCCPNCSPASLLQPVIQLINQCNVMKRTILNIKEPPEKIYPLRGRL